MNKKRRTVNYRSSDRPATLRKQATIREVLALANEGLTVSEVARALGCSRQLALYHVKKLAAKLGCVMVSTRCSANGQFQWLVWDEGALMAHCARRMLQTYPVRQPTSDIRELAHGVAA